VPGWLDRLIKTKGESAQEAYKYYKDALTALHKWFHHIFIPYPAGMLVNAPVVAHLDTNHTYYGKVDMFSPELGEAVVFTTDQVPLLHQYNDLEMFTHLWAVEKFLGVKIDTCVKLIISPRKVEEKRYKITPEVKDRVCRSIDFLMNGITNQIFHPSISLHCSTCPYRFRCSI
jgi:hypothetical protein